MKVKPLEVARVVRAGGEASHQSIDVTPHLITSSGLAAISHKSWIGEEGTWTLNSIGCHTKKSIGMGNVTTPPHHQLMYRSASTAWRFLYSHML